MVVKEVNNSNFENEVLKSKKPVIVDFWAAWCVDPHETLIITDQNHTKLARDIKEKDTLLTYNGNKIITDSVKKSFTSNKLGHCKEIITETNRSLKVTDNHEFFTQNGWKAAKDLKQGEKVAIIPTYLYEKKVVKKDKIILKKEDIIKVATKSMRIDKYLKELEDLNLLSLNLNHNKLAAIARLLGCIFSDGNLYIDKRKNYREVSFCLGTKKDVNAVINDLKNIGVEKIQLSKNKNKININNRTYIITTNRAKICSTSFWLLFKALGAPVGDKTNTSYTLPIWLLKAPKYIKREFLASYMGGDGPKISMSLVNRPKKQPYNHVGINDIEFHKHKKAEKSGLQLAKQLAQLFEEFNVKIRKIFSKQDNYIKKDGTKSKIIHIAIFRNFENAFNLYKNIGYRYAYTKDLESKQVVEFIRKILNTRKKWVSHYKKVIELRKKYNYGYRKIAKLMDINKGTVAGWIYQNKNPTITKHYLKYPKWLEENTKGLNDGLMWEPLKKINDIYLESVQKITMVTNHNFIANGFLAHNCGPCKTMKPVFEELSDEMKSIKFCSLDVDKNSNTAGRYGVRGIPTFLIFKDGELVDQFVGALSKSQLKEKLIKI